MSGIKEKVKNIFYPLIPYRLLRAINGVNPIIPFYHIVSDEEVPHIKHLYKACPIKKFEKDLDFFLQRYIPITLLELVTYLAEERPLPSKSFILTFDDGLREFYEIAVPILVKKGLSATLFICSAFLDNKALCYDHKRSVLQENITQKDIKISPREIEELFGSTINCSSIEKALRNVDYQCQKILDVLAEKFDLNWNDYLYQHKPYITSNQVEDLLHKGFTVGAHSVDHPHYNKLSLKEQVSQTKESIEFLVKKFSLPYRVFGLPYAAQGISQNYFDTIFEERVCDILFGSAGFDNVNHKRYFSRVWMENRLTATKVIVNEYYINRLLKKMSG